MIALWKRLRWPIWIAAGLYWAAIFTATHLPPRDVPNTHLNDKVEHIGAYGLLLGALSLCIAPLLARSWRWALILLLVAAAYGAFDERTQPYFGRDCDIHDWYADLTGGTIAIVSMKFTLQALLSRPSPRESSD